MNKKFAKEWCNIIYGILMQKTDDIPIISVDGYDDSIGFFQITKEEYEMRKEQYEKYKKDIQNPYYGCFGVLDELKILKKGACGGGWFAGGEFFLYIAKRER